MAQLHFGSIAAYLQTTNRELPRGYLNTHGGPSTEGTTSAGNYRNSPGVEWSNRSKFATLLVPFAIDSVCFLHGYPSKMSSSPDSDRKTVPRAIHPATSEWRGHYQLKTDSSWNVSFFDISLTELLDAKSTEHAEIFARVSQSTIPIHSYTRERKATTRPIDDPRAVSGVVYFVETIYLLCVLLSLHLWIISYQR